MSHDQLPSKETKIQEFIQKEDLPFGADPDEPYPVIAPNVIYAKGRSSPWKGTPAVMKVVQIVNRDGMSIDASKRACRKEAKIMFAARHVHAMHIMTAYFDSSQSINKPRFVIIMGRALGGDLSAYLDPPKRPQERWAGCLIHAIAHIHRLGIRHRDIKPQNVLIDRDEVLLTDFGISHMSLGKTVHTTNDKWNKPRTPDYCAPEVDEGFGRTRGRSADIFSLGAVILEILLSHSYHDTEYKKLKEIMGGVSEGGTYSSRLDAVHRLVSQLIDRLLSPNSAAGSSSGKSVVPVATHWHHELLLICRNMLDGERDRRPSADEIKSCWIDKVVPRAKGHTEHPLACECATVQPDETNEDKLITACRNRQLDEVDKLLSKGTNPNVEGAIHHAALAGHRDVVNTLLQQREAQVNTQDYAGQTALHYAAMNGQGDVIKLLLKNKADVNQVDDQGQSPLHCAATHGSKTNLELLINGGGEADKVAFINTADMDGLTALHHAARKNRKGAVEFLLEQGADKTMADKRTDKTAWNYADERGFKDVAKLLKRWDAKKKKVTSKWKLF